MLAIDVGNKENFCLVETLSWREAYWRVPWSYHGMSDACDYQIGKCGDTGRSRLSVLPVPPKCSELISQKLSPINYIFYIDHAVYNMRILLTTLSMLQI